MRTAVIVIIAVLVACSAAAKKKKRGGHTNKQNIHQLACGASTVDIPKMLKGEFKLLDYQARGWEKELIQIPDPNVADQIEEIQKHSGLTGYALVQGVVPLGITYSEAVVAGLPGQNSLPGPSDNVYFYTAHATSCKDATVKSTLEVQTITQSTYFSMLTSTAVQIAANPLQAHHIRSLATISSAGADVQVANGIIPDYLTASFSSTVSSAKAASSTGFFHADHTALFLVPDLEDSVDPTPKSIVLYTAPVPYAGQSFPIACADLAKVECPRKEGKQAKKAAEETTKRSKKEAY